jgi:hypothetical protein
MAKKRKKSKRSVGSFDYGSGKLPKMSRKDWAMYDRLRSNGQLVAKRANGKPVKRNTSVKMSLHDLRRLISGAKSGKRVKVKARVR